MHGLFEKLRINYLTYDFASHLEYKFSKKKDVNSYVAFTQTELQKIISGHIYQPNKSNRRKSDDFIFWAPLLGMYTGGRVNELAQLLVDDIRQEKETGIWYINILDDEVNPNKNTNKQSVKTDSSRRKVPLHPVLINLGFLSFVKMKRAGSNHQMLFHTGIKYYEKGKFGKAVSDWFNGDVSKGNGYKVDCGIERGTGKVFHSFRHGFAENLLGNVGEHVDLSRKGSLIGHEELKSANASKITLIYTKEYSLTVLQKAINQLDYKIDLSQVSFEHFLIKHSKFDALESFRTSQQQFTLCGNQSL